MGFTCCVHELPGPRHLHLLGVSASLMTLRRCACVQVEAGKANAATFGTTATALTAAVAPMQKCVTPPARHPVTS